MFDHEYTLLVHPKLRARLSYRRGDDDGELAAATVRLDYRRDDEWTDEEAAVALPDRHEGPGVELKGFELSLYRDGERVLSRGFSSSLVSEAIDALGSVETVAPSLARRVRDAAARAGGESADDRVEMTQMDGSTVEALAPPAKATFEVYEGRDGKWRWRLVHDNGNVVADSGQGYSSKRAAEKGLRSVKRNALGAAVEPVEGGADHDVRSASDAEREGTGTGSAES